jgi:hypothetical protein
MNSTNYKLINSLDVFTRYLFTINLSFVWILVDGTRNKIYPGLILLKICSRVFKPFSTLFHLSGTTEGRLS